MKIATHALALVGGCAAGFLAMAVMFAEVCWRTCENVHPGKGFECSECKSHTDYEPNVPFNFCPICGAFVRQEERV